MCVSVQELTLKAKQDNIDKMLPNLLVFKFSDTMVQQQVLLLRHEQVC